MDEDARISLHDGNTVAAWTASPEPPPRYESVTNRPTNDNHLPPIVRQPTVQPNEPEQTHSGRHQGQTIRKWSQRQIFINCIVFVVGVLVTLLVTIPIILINRSECGSTQTKHQKLIIERIDHDICKSEHCINLSARVTDKSVSPCEDFHAFACGSLIKNRSELPPPPPEEEVKNMIKEMVEPGDSQAFKMQKYFYMSCSNLEAIERDDDKTVLDLFSAVGDWPVLRGADWDDTLFGWTDVAKKSRKIGLKFDWFLDFSVYEDVNDTRLNMLKIDIPPLSPLNESEIFPRQTLFSKIAVTLGAPGYIRNETVETIAFENALGTLAEEHRGRKKHLDLGSLPRVTIREVQKELPNIIWLRLINNITGLNMKRTDYIIFDQVSDYVKDLNQLIDTTPKRIVANYMMFKIVEECWQYLSQPVREKFEEFYQQHRSHLPELDRQKFCIDESKKQFPLIAESEYIRRHVTQQKRELVNEMLFIIRKKFVQLLIRRGTWVNKRAREIALQMLDNLEFSVGGPRQVFDEFGFAEDLGLIGFVFRSTNVIDMLTERKVRSYDNYFRAVNKVISNKTEEFYEKVVDISRFIVINRNTLVIPVSVLRDVFYDPTLPNYFIYATLGKMLAHEMFEHLFKKNINPFLWDEVFESTVECLINKISHMHNPEFSVFKKPEKIRLLLADVMAPELAYEAYKEWDLMHPQESKLLALEFTPNELFWIHTSKLSCDKTDSKEDRDYSRFKIIAPLTNSDYFASDFNCTVGSKMFSGKPCHIV